MIREAALLEYPLDLQDSC
jgi:actin-related protein 6